MTDHEGLSQKRWPLFFCEAVAGINKGNKVRRISILGNGCRKSNTALDIVGCFRFNCMHIMKEEANTVLFLE